LLGNRQVRYQSLQFIFISPSFISSGEVNIDQNISNLLVVLRRVLFPVLFGMLFVGCGGGGGGGSAANENNNPVTLVSGSDVAVTSKVITPTGGIIDVGERGTPIDNVQVQFPAGALPKDTNISLGYNT